MDNNGMSHALMLLAFLLQDVASDVASGVASRPLKISASGRTCYSGLSYSETYYAGTRISLFRSYYFPGTGTQLKSGADTIPPELMDGNLKVLLI